MRIDGRRVRLRGWMRRAALVCLGLLLHPRAGVAQPETRLLLLPLDDRPSSVRFPVQIGALAGAAVITPPIALLGRFTQPADVDGVHRWLRDWLLDPRGRATASPSVPPIDALIVSIDLLAYGGLVASRTIESATPRQAIARLTAAGDDDPLGRFETIVGMPVDQYDRRWRERITSLRNSPAAPAAGDRRPAAGRDDR